MSSNVAEISLSSRFVKKRTFKFDLDNGEFLNPNATSGMLIDDAGQEYVSKVLNAKSADKSIVPIKVVHKKGMKLDGNNPVLVEGYGGFGVSGYFNPFYKNFNKQFIDDGGVYVAPALRGGNELGIESRKQATLKNKQNTFNDMIATVEKLIKSKYSNPSKIAIQGWSNGGLLMGAMVTQRPDLFKLVIPGNGVLDMLRKEVLDPRFDGGWSYEYGNSQDVEAFEFLSKYSPVHNAKAQSYPTVLIVVGNSDSRVNPAHSYKFAKALEAAQTGEGKIHLLNVNNSGHWVTKNFEDTRSKAIAQIMTTIYKELGMTVPKKLSESASELP